MGERFRHFDTQGRFWTPAWDFFHREPKTVQAVRLADGTWHEFSSMVCVAEADALYQASIRQRLGLSA